MVVAHFHCAPLLSCHGLSFAPLPLLSHLLSALAGCCVALLRLMEASDDKWKTVEIDGCGSGHDWHMTMRDGWMSDASKTDAVTVVAVVVVTHSQPPGNPIICHPLPPLRPERQALDVLVPSDIIPQPLRRIRWVQGSCIACFKPKWTSFCDVI